MANQGKFTDRSPIICSAGLPSIQSDKVKNCLTEYKVQESVDAVKHAIGIFKENEIMPPYKPQHTKNFRNAGIYDAIGECLRPPIKTRYQTLINDLKETSYRSFWEKCDGKQCDPIGNLPPDIDTLDVTFGKPSKRDITVKELVNPPKPHYKVLWDSQVGHEMYRKTHCNYNPSEQINRNYVKPPFDPKRRYGMKTCYDPRGILIRCLCMWHLYDPVYTLTKRQADFAQRTRYSLGKVLEPNKNIDCVPEGHTFGAKSLRSLFNVSELLRDPGIEPCLFKRNFYQWMKHLNQMREYIKKRKMFNFNLDELYNKMLYYDKDKSGWVSLDVFYNICRCYGIVFEQEPIEALVDFLGYLHECCVFYRGFLDLIDVNKPLPIIKKINDVPEEHLYYISTNMVAMCDYLLIDNSKMPAAGSFGKDMHLPKAPPFGCKADINSLGNETTTGQIIYPSIYTNYGLSHRDFFKPRKPQVLRELFEKIGYQFTEDTFKKLWEVGVERDKTGLVCVDTFYNLLQECVPPATLLRDVKECPEPA